MRKSLRLPPNFSLEKARAFQKYIAKKAIRHDDFDSAISRVAGVDLTYRGQLALAVAVAVDAHTMKHLETQYAIIEEKFPYIPTLLAFREVGPAALALKRLKTKVNVVFVDGSGLLHPYKAGFATHLGIVLNVPTIGVTKKLLCGKIGKWHGNKAPIYLDSEIVGMAVKTIPRANPIYVSIGHKVSLKTAVDLVKYFTKKRSKLPLPIQLAHNEAQRLARELLLQQ